MHRAGHTCQICPTACCAISVQTLSRFWLNWANLGKLGYGHVIADVRAVEENRTGGQM